MPRGRYFTPEEDAVIRAGLSPSQQLTRDQAREIADRLGRTESSIRLRVRYLKIGPGWVKPEMAASADSVARRCLRCGDRFAAPTRFIRVCNACKNSDAWTCGA